MMQIKQDFFPCKIWVQWTQMLRSLKNSLPKKCKKCNPYCKCYMSICKCFISLVLVFIFCLLIDLWDFLIFIVVDTELLLTISLTQCFQCGDNTDIVIFWSTVPRPFLISPDSSRLTLMFVRRWKFKALPDDEEIPILDRQKENEAILLSKHSLNSKGTKLSDLKKLRNPLQESYFGK